ncbi:hypothetical protein AX774_g2479 [Zancudomyces culisetae]|uniref:Uncharacterized protein n=1 Tax=Zancudomyces culisetae TaxID=1213189 RepID=A0A1R1PST1_ZANCU|nr:hypothetical protein AX774_g2479 [Zancudomyces culisetae]|eukprot:OMH84017.1 hypothetical protein AX774_g2479 [Zancudomyces culisetae]
MQTSPTLSFVLLPPSNSAPLHYSDNCVEYTDSRLLPPVHPLLDLLSREILHMVVVAATNHNGFSGPLYIGFSALFALYTPQDIPVSPSLSYKTPLLLSLQLFSPPSPFPPLPFSSPLSPPSSKALEYTLSPPPNLLYYSLPSALDSANSYNCCPYTLLP